MNCLTIALEKPPKDGEYRVLNQFDQYYSVNYLAQTVKEVYEETAGKEAEIRHVKNPRVESEDHYYNPDHEKLYNLGYRPSGDVRKEIRNMIADLEKYREKCVRLKDVIMPKTFWKRSAGIRE